MGIRKGQIQRQFSDENDDTRNLNSPSSDSLYGPPKARRPAGELGDIGDEILQEVQKIQEETDEGEEA